MRRIAAAQALERAGNLSGAARAYRELIAADPADAGLHYLLGCALVASLDLEAGLAALDEAIRLRPTVPEFFAMRAIALRASQRLDEAIEAADRGLAVDPRNLGALEVKGDLLFTRGEVEAGIRLMLPAYEAGCANPQYLATLARLLSSAGRIAEARRVLERAVGAPGGGRAKAWPHMQLGELLERTGDYAGAWRHYTAANAVRGAVFNPDLHEAAVAETMAAWSAERLARLPRAAGGERLVFIVGMPRSGTSLVEQIVASHPLVHGGGELNHIVGAAMRLIAPTAERPTIAARLDALTGEALEREAERIERAMTAPAPGAERFTDKQPQNFLHLGMIGLLFPRARVIHCRRDARDTCLSCYTRLFGGGANQPFAGRLDHLGRYYRAYERIMAHWRGVLSIPVLDVAYEEVVSDLEGNARRMIEFVGLGWDEACLRFYETRRDVITESRDQVRRPIYASSVGRWKRFERELGPLCSALAP